MHHHLWDDFKNSESHVQADNASNIVARLSLQRSSMSDLPTRSYKALDAISQQAMEPGHTPTLLTTCFTYESVQKRECMLYFKNKNKTVSKLLPNPIKLKEGKKYLSKRFL